MLAASFFDEIQKKGLLEVYWNKTRQVIGGPIEFQNERKAIAWHPKINNLLAVAGEAKEQSMQTSSGMIELITLK